MFMSPIPKVLHALIMMKSLRSFLFFGGVVDKL